MRPTINDIASRAGVSKTTVSFALNDPSRISAETYARIMAIVDRAGLRARPRGQDPDHQAPRRARRPPAPAHRRGPAQSLPLRADPRHRRGLRGARALAHDAAADQGQDHRGRARAFVDGLITIGVGPRRRGRGHPPSPPHPLRHDRRGGGRRDHQRRHRRRRGRPRHHGPRPLPGPPEGSPSSRSGPRPSISPISATPWSRQAAGRVPERPGRSRPPPRVSRASRSSRSRCSLEGGERGGPRASSRARRRPAHGHARDGRRRRPRRLQACEKLGLSIPGRLERRRLRRHSLGRPAPGRRSPPCASRAWKRARPRPLSS